VRRLAERSRIAASEIRGVARGSVTTADRSSGLFAELLASIRSNAELAREVASTMDEQAAGVGQINRSMLEMDRITQENSASADALAVTARELAGRAASLREHLQTFRLERDAAPPSASLPGPDSTEVHDPQSSKVVRVADARAAKARGA
jgi:methyl-accepting chemotaxis protein